MKISIARFEKYPQDEPMGFAVGFTVECETNGRSFYRDTVIPFTDLTETSTDEDITKKAFMQIKTSVDNEYEKIKDRKGVIIGSSLVMDNETGNITIDTSVTEPKLPPEPEPTVSPDIVMNDDVIPDEGVVAQG